jgi:hypothetical protein
MADFRKNPHVLVMWILPQGRHISRPKKKKCHPLLCGNLRRLRGSFALDGVKMGGTSPAHFASTDVAEVPDMAMTNRERARTNTGAPGLHSATAVKLARLCNPSGLTTRIGCLPRVSGPPLIAAVPGGNPGLGCGTLSAYAEGMRDDSTHHLRCAGRHV